jgi:biopolymer transport protein ExbB
MSFNLMKVFHEMDLMARGVTCVLLIMSIASLSVCIERLIAFARSRAQSKAFSTIAVPLIADEDYRRLRERAGDFRASHLARLLTPPLDILLANREGEFPNRGATVEQLRRELARQHEEAGADLRRGFGVLASVGSVAPFVGLLGTVVGIIAAFSKISVTGSGGLGSVAGGISEALVVTALGLVVAIPAVLIFNMLSGRAERIHQSLAIAAGQFLDNLEFKNQPRQPRTRASSEEAPAPEESTRADHPNISIA